jgi:hypothetical protein
MVGQAHTFVVWSKLGEFLLRSPEPISESGRPLLFVGEAVGVLFMRSGDTCTCLGTGSPRCQRDFLKLTASF